MRAEATQLMRKTALSCIVALAIVATTAPAFGQVQIIQTGPGSDMGPIQLPQPGRELKTGTGRIKGRLMTADTGTPVRRAEVRISGQEILPKTAITDAEGRFEFRDLPTGRFSLNATKPGFVTVSYGQRRPFESGKQIELGDGQVLDRADFSMPRGSAIAGRIVDEFGDPIADVQVSAMRSTWLNGKRRLQSTGRMAQTNDLGQYRIYGLPPGDYYVSATVRGGADMVMVERVAATFVASGGAGGNANNGPSASDPKTGYAPTYYPGTSDGASAQKIVLAVGQEMGNADFSMLAVRLARVTGMVIGSDGRPVEGAMVSTNARNSADAGMMFFPMMGSGRTDKNGQFSLTNIAPGDYTVHARGVQTMSSDSGGERVMFTMRIDGGGGGNGQTEFGSAPLSVGGDDVSNLVIVTSKGSSVSGKIVFEGGAKPTNTATVRIAAQSAENEAMPMMSGGSASITPEGTFEIKGMLGPRLFRVNGLPQGWILKSVTHNGTDVTDSGVDVKANEPVSGIEITVTNKLTEITGAVMGSDSKPSTDYTLVVFSQDADKWRVPMTRHISGTRPNQDGRFLVKNMPAGDYYAVALEYIASGDWNDPEVLERLKSKATKFRLDEGAVKTLDLKLSGN